jgi:hypothetical protein
MQQVNLLRVDEAESFADAAFAQARLDLWRDVHVAPALREFEPELAAEGFHGVEALRDSARAPRR